MRVQGFMSIKFHFWACLTYSLIPIDTNPYMEQSNIQQSVLKLEIYTSSLLQQILII